MADSRELQILVTAKDETSKSLGNIKGKLEDMKPAFQKMAVAGTVAFGTITTAVGLSIKAFQKQEQIETKLAHVMKQTTNASDAQIQSLKDQASQLQSLGVIGDETTMALQAQLSTFMLSTDTIKTMTPAILDMIVAEKGVNATSEDMISFANAFGMAMEGNYGALTKRGFKLDEATKQMIENGTETQKAQAITGYLTSTYDGMNEAMRATSAGGMSAMKNSFGDLQEAIGKAFLPILERLLPKITEIIDKTIKWSQENPELLSKIILIGGAVSALVAGLGMLGLVMPMIIAGFALLISPVGLVVIGIGLVTVAILLLMKNWDALQVRFNEGVDVITAKIKGFQKMMTDVWSNTWNSAGSLVDSIFAGIKSTVTSSINWIISKINGFIEKANAIIRAGNVIPGVNLPTFPTIPMLAKGGIVNKPTLAMIGEAGPEAVVPLNKKNSGMGGGLTIIVNGDISGQDLIEKVSNGIMNNLRNNTQLAF